jgi:hypothetical protein
MKVPGIILLTLASTPSGLGQHVVDPHASVADVTSRQATLRTTIDPLLRAAIQGLGSCVATPFVVFLAAFPQNISARP